MVRKAAVHRRRDRTPLLVSLAAGLMLAGIAGWYAFYLGPSAEEKAADEILGDVAASASAASQETLDEREIEPADDVPSPRATESAGTSDIPASPQRHVGAESRPDTEPVTRANETPPSTSAPQTPELAAKGPPPQTAEPPPGRPPQGSPPSAAEAARFEAALRAVRQALGERVCYR